jgi:deazaflavin-dependent oxidoreductase (nitroreductase family)
MSLSNPRPNILQRLVHTIPSTSIGAKFFSFTMHRLDRPFLQWTNERLALSSIFTGLPIVTLITTGAKTGRRRETPLVAIPVGDKVILIASNWGGTYYPAWYHNLRAHPTATILYGGEKQMYIAHEATGHEYDTYWRKAISLYKGYAAYKTRTKGRPIPIIILEPE